MWVAFIRPLNQAYWAILKATLQNVGYIKIVVVDKINSVSCFITFSLFVLDSFISFGPTYNNRNIIDKFDSYLIENIASQLQKSTGKFLQ
jgi:hypothetical protein